MPRVERLHARSRSGGLHRPGALPQRKRADGSLSSGIKSISKEDLAPTASLDELSTCSGTEELVKQSPGFLLTSPTALLDGGRAGTRPKSPASLLAPRSAERHQLFAAPSRESDAHMGRRAGSSCAAQSPSQLPQPGPGTRAPGGASPPSHGHRRSLPHPLPGRGRQHAAVTASTHRTAGGLTARRSPSRRTQATRWPQTLAPWGERHGPGPRHAGVSSRDSSSSGSTWREEINFSAGEAAMGSKPPPDALCRGFSHRRCRRNAARETRRPHRVGWRTDRLAERG